MGKAYSRIISIQKFRCILSLSDNKLNLNPNVAKVGGLQSQGVKVEIVIVYIDPLTTQDLKSSGFPVG